MPAWTASNGSHPVPRALKKQKVTQIKSVVTAIPGESSPTNTSNAMEELPLIETNVYGVAQLESISATTYNVEVEKEVTTSEEESRFPSFIEQSMEFKSNVEEDIPVKFDQMIQYHDEEILSEQVAKTWPKGSGNSTERTDEVYKEIATLVDVLLVNGDTFFRSLDLSLAWAPRETAKASDGFQWCTWGGPTVVDGHPVMISSQRFAENCARCILRMVADRPRVSTVIVCFTKHKRAASSTLDHLDCAPEQHYGKGSRTKPLPKLSQLLHVDTLRNLGLHDDGYVSLVCERIAKAIVDTNIPSTFPNASPAAGSKILFDCDWGLQSALTLDYDGIDHYWSGWIDQRITFAPLYEERMETSKVGETPEQKTQRKLDEKRQEKKRANLAANLSLHETSRAVPEASDCCLGYLYWLLHSDPFRKATTTKKGEKEAEQYTVELLSDSDDWFLRIMLMLFNWRAGRRMSANLIEFGRLNVPEFRAAWDNAGTNEKEQEKAIRKFEIEILTNAQVAENGVDWPMWELAGAAQVYMRKVARNPTTVDTKKKKKKQSTKKKIITTSEEEETTVDAGEIGENTLPHLWDITRLTTTFVRGVGKSYFDKGRTAKVQLAETERGANVANMTKRQIELRSLQLRSNTMLATKGIFDAACVSAIVACVQLANALTQDLLIHEKSEDNNKKAAIAGTFFSHSRVLSRWLQIVEDPRFDFVLHQLCMVDLSVGIVRMHQWNLMLFALALLNQGHATGTESVANFYFTHHARQGTLKLVILPRSIRSESEEQMLEFEYGRAGSVEEEELQMGSLPSSPESQPPIEASSNPGFDFLDKYLSEMVDVERKSFFDHLATLFGTASTKWFLNELNALLRDPLEGLEADSAACLSLLPPVSVSPDGSVHSAGLLPEDVLYQLVTAMEAMNKTDLGKFIKPIEEDKENKNAKLIAKADVDVREYIDRMRAADTSKSGPQNTLRREAITEETAELVKAVFYDAPLKAIIENVDRPVFYTSIQTENLPKLEVGSMDTAAVVAYHSAEELRSDVTRAFLENSDRMVDYIRRTIRPITRHLATPDITSVNVGTGEGGAFLYVATQLRKMIYDCLQMYLQALQFRRAPLLQSTEAASAFLRSLLARTWWNSICDFRCADWSFRHGGQLCAQGMLTRPYDLIRIRVNEQKIVNVSASKQQDAWGDAGQWGKVRIDHKSAPTKNLVRSLSLVHKDERTALVSGRLTPMTTNRFSWMSGLRKHYNTKVSYVLQNLGEQARAGESVTTTLARKLENIDPRQVFDQAGLSVHIRYDDTSGWEPVDTHTRITYEDVERRNLLQTDFEQEEIDWQEPTTLCSLDGPADNKKAIPNPDKAALAYSTAYYHAISQGDANPYGDRFDQPMFADTWLKDIRENVQFLYKGQADVQKAVLAACRNYSDSLIPHKSNTTLSVEMTAGSERVRSMTAYSYLFGDREKTERPYAPTIRKKAGAARDTVDVLYSTENAVFSGIESVSELLFYCVFKLLPVGFLAGQREDVRLISLIPEELYGLFVMVSPLLYPSTESKRSESTAEQLGDSLKESVSLLLASESLYDLCEFFEVCMLAKFNQVVTPGKTSLIDLMDAILYPNSKFKRLLPDVVQHASTQMWKCNTRLRHITQAVQMASELHARSLVAGTLLLPLSLDPVLPDVDLNLQRIGRTSIVGQTEETSLLTMRICEYNTLLQPANSTADTTITELVESYGGITTVPLTKQLDVATVGVNVDLLELRKTDPVILRLRDNWDGKDYLTAVWSKAGIATEDVTLQTRSNARVDIEADLLPWWFSQQGSALACRLRCGPTDWLIRFVDHLANAANRDLDYSSVDRFFKYTLTRYKFVNVAAFKQTHTNVKQIHTGFLVHSLYASKLDTFYNLSDSPVVATREFSRDPTSENVQRKVFNSFSREVYDTRQRDNSAKGELDAAPRVAVLMASQKESEHPDHVPRSVRDSVLLLEFDCRISTAISASTTTGVRSRLPLWSPTEKRWFCMFNWCAYKHLAQEQVSDLVLNAKRITMDDAQFSQPEISPSNACSPVSDMEYLIVPKALADHIMKTNNIANRREDVDFPVGITLPRYHPYTGMEMTAEQAANVALYVYDTRYSIWPAESYLEGLCHGMDNDKLPLAVALNELRRQRNIGTSNAQQPEGSNQRRSLAEDTAHGRTRLMRYLHSTLNVDKTRGSRTTFITPYRESLRGNIVSYAMTGDFASAVGKEIFPRSPFVWSGKGKDLNEKLIPELVERLRSMCSSHLSLQNVISNGQSRCLDLTLLDEILLSYSSPERLGIRETISETQREEETSAMINAAEQGTWYERLRASDDTSIALATADRPLVMRTSRYELVLFRTLLVRFSNIIRMPKLRTSLGSTFTESMDVSRKLDLNNNPGSFLSVVSLGEIIDTLTNLAQQPASGLSIQLPPGTEQMTDALAQETDALVKLADGRFETDQPPFVLSPHSEQIKKRTEALLATPFLTVLENILQRKQRLVSLDLFSKGKQPEGLQSSQLSILCPSTTQIKAEFVLSDYLLRSSLQWIHTRDRYDLVFLRIMGESMRFNNARSAGFMETVLRSAVESRKPRPGQVVTSESPEYRYRIRIATGTHLQDIIPLYVGKDLPVNLSEEEREKAEEPESREPVSTLQSLLSLLGCLVQQRGTTARDSVFVHADNMQEDSLVKFIREKLQRGLPQRMNADEVRRATEDLYASTRSEQQPAAKVMLEHLHESILADQVNEDKLEDEDEQTTITTQIIRFFSRCTGLSVALYQIVDDAVRGNYFAQLKAVEICIGPEDERTPASLAMLDRVSVARMPHSRRYELFLQHTDINLL